MLSVKHYDKEHVNRCRSWVDGQLEGFSSLPEGAAKETYEPRFCEAAVLGLDAWFVHRMRAAEGKDGNPLNEVRVICGSILAGSDTLLSDSQIKLSRDDAILGIGYGEQIAIGAAGLERLAAAFLSEIEKRYG